MTSRLKPITILAACLLGAALIAGVFVNENWLYVAFAGMMVFMHAFGHGSHGHGSSHEEHAGHGDGAS